jgi:hypothetical protein
MLENPISTMRLDLVPMLHYTSVQDVAVTHDHIHRTPFGLDIEQRRSRELAVKKFVAAVNCVRCSVASSETA